MKAIVIGIKTVGRKETLEHAVNKYGWKDVVIGIGHKHGLIAWVIARLLGKKFIYYCIDFYTYQIRQSYFDGFTIWRDMHIDKFLCRHADIIWDISKRINEGRSRLGNYSAISKIVPLTYPDNYFRFKTKGIDKTKLAFVGISPYGIELVPDSVNFVWLGKSKLLPTDELLEQLSSCGIGLSVWKKNGNNYYGDPGKTKLYSACGLPVIMTNNTPYSEVILKTDAGVIIPYDQRYLLEAINMILNNYGYYKANVQRTWSYIKSDEILRDIRILE